MSADGHLQSADVTVPCVECGAAATRVQLLWDGGGWRFVYSGIEGGNGDGQQVSEERARDIAIAFAEPLEYARVHEAGLYDDAGFCQGCGAPYCSSHWNISTSGGGHCPKGHFKSLDPHWSPDF